jgi:hypothetical protein
MCYGSRPVCKKYSRGRGEGYPPKYQTPGFLREQCESIGTAEFVYVMADTGVRTSEFRVVDDSLLIDRGLPAVLSPSIPRNDETKSRFRE